MDHDYVDKKIDAKIIEINNSDNVYEVGTVVNVKEFIIEVTGINNVMFYEKINIANKALGYVNSINESSVTVAVLKIDSPINVGDMVYSTNKLYMGAYSPSSFGRVIDLFGVDKLSGRKYNDLTEIPIERKTIPIMDRGTVNRPMLTGISGIDLMYPIGRGQRQLIIGDKRTGKTQIGLDAIVNQRGQNVLCFYVAIGKTKKEVKNIYNQLMKKGALEYTTIVTAFNDELPPVISLIPYFALSVAENYMMQGYDILVVIDDLKRHAEAYREISLISGKTPGRDAYPADIFYTHSRLLEKGCQHKNGGSITILPIVETKGGDITDYISTNVISITDGQIVLSDKAFQKGEKPAINYGLSVSRLGGAVQEKDMKAVGSVVRRKLLSYLETRSVYELVNMDEMSPELRNQFIEGKEILSKLLQYKFSPKTPQQMMAMFDEIVNGPKDPEKSKDDKYLSENKEDSVFDRNSNQYDEPGSAVPVPNADPNVDPNAPMEVTPSVEKDITAFTDDAPVTAVPIEETITDSAFAVEEKLPNEVDLSTEAAAEAPIETEATVFVNEMVASSPVDMGTPSEGFELPVMDMSAPSIDSITNQEFSVPVADTDFEEPVISMVIPDNATEEEVEEMIQAFDVENPTLPKMDDILEQSDLKQDVSIDVPGFDDDKPETDNIETVSVDYDFGEVAFELNEDVKVDKIEVSSDDGINISASDVTEDATTEESTDVVVDPTEENGAIDVEEIQQESSENAEVNDETAETSEEETALVEEEKDPLDDTRRFAFNLNLDGDEPEEVVEDNELDGKIVREAPEGEFDKDTYEEEDNTSNEVNEESSTEETEYSESYEATESNESEKAAENNLDISQDEDEVYSEEFDFDFPDENNSNEEESTESSEDEKEVEEDIKDSDLEIPEDEEDVYSESFEFPEEIVEEKVEEEVPVEEPKENEFVPFENPNRRNYNNKKKKNANKKKSEEEVI